MSNRFPADRLALTAGKAPNFLNTPVPSPFRIIQQLMVELITWGEWWATKDLNLGPLPCEGSALTTELVAHRTYFL
jgi:hypothetical protein